MLYNYTNTRRFFLLNIINGMLLSLKEHVMSFLDIFRKSRLYLFNVKQAPK